LSLAAVERDHHLSAHFNVIVTFTPLLFGKKMSELD
jgi:hypothetical protein